MEAPIKTFVAKKDAEQRTIEFELAGDEYHFVVGKSSDILLSLLSARRGQAEGLDQTRELLNWLGAGLNPDHEDHNEGPIDSCETCRLQTRLLDKRDLDVDLDVVMEVVNWLIQEVSGQVTTGRPTTSRSGF